MLTRSFQGIIAVSDEVKEKLSAVDSCPEPCDDGTVSIFWLPGEARRKFPCPLLAPDCHYGRRMERGLDRYIADVMADIGVPLRHLENFPKRQRTEEEAEASKWPMRGFLIFTGGTGTGKSFGAALVLRSCLKSQVANPLDRRSWESAEKAGRSVLWCSAMDITDDREIAARAKGWRLVVIDDLGGESEKGQAAICGVLLKRYDMKLPTVITTSLTMLDIDIRYGNRIANRLIEDIGNGGKIIECKDISMCSMSE
jgi:hypothetical protein